MISLEELFPHGSIVIRHIVERVPEEAFYRGSRIILKVQIPGSSGKMELPVTITDASREPHQKAVWVFDAVLDNGISVTGRLRQKPHRSGYGGVSRSREGFE